jgi:hypothetical protein
MRRYKVIQGGGLWGVKDGATIEIDISPEDEAEYVDARKWLEIEPRAYKVVGPQEVYGAKHGESFEAALSANQEAALIAGGHIEFDEAKKGGKKRG